MCIGLIFRRITPTNIQCLLCFIIYKNDCWLYGTYFIYKFRCQKFYTSLGSPIYKITPCTARKTRYGFSPAAVHFLSRKITSQLCATLQNKSNYYSYSNILHQRCAFTKHGLRYVNKQMRFTFAYVCLQATSRQSFVYQVYLSQKKNDCLLNVYLPSLEQKFVYQKIVYIEVISHYVK